MNKLETIEALRKEHGKVAVVEIDDRLFVFRKPKGSEIKRMNREVEKDVSLASFNLAAATMVCPAENKMAAVQWLEDEYAMALLKIANGLQDLAGSEVAVEIAGN